QHLVARVPEPRQRGDVPALGGPHLEPAGELRGGGHLGRPRRAAHRRATRPTSNSTIAAATSHDVASCRPRHPGIPFTSTTYTVPSRAGSRSTSAASAPTARA